MPPATDYALIVGQDLRGAIGRDNRLPWKISSDMQFFRRQTLGKAVIMGRNTWESLPAKPLPQRLNIVVSSTLAAPADNAYRVARSTDEALGIARAAGRQPVVIGGERLYREMLQQASEVFLTQVDAEIEGGDTFFPELSGEEWQREHLDDFVADERNEYGGAIYRYFRETRGAE